MAKITVTPRWTQGLDMALLCRNWETGPAGTEHRMGCRYEPVKALGRRANYLAARMPRPMFAMCWPSGVANKVGADPLCRWRYDDLVTNARAYRITVIYVPRTEGTGNCYGAQWSGADNYDSAATSGYIMTGPDVFAAVDWFEDVAIATFDVARGAAAAAMVEDGLSTFNGFTVLAVSVQDLPIDGMLDNTLHTCVNVNLSKKGGYVLGDLPESIRNTIHDVRTKNLPIVFSWSALGSTATPASTDATAIVVTSATYVNVQEQSVTARSATSPGINVDMQYCGRGTLNAYGGNLAKVRCEVLANSAAGDGTVKFEGPDHVANNYAEITVTSGGGLAWYGAASDIFYLNSNIAGIDTSTAQNKTDILAKVAAGTLYIYGLRCWIEYA